MNTIFLPADFSPNAYNAARYAFELAADIHATKIILYNAFQPYVSEDPELSVSLQTNLNEYKQISEEGLIKMKNALEAEMHSPIEIIYKSDYNVLTSGIIEASEEHNAGIIVMGITGAESKLEETLIGSTAVDVSKRSKIPVIIVPQHAKYSGLKNILLAIDFKKIVETTPVAEIKNLLDITNAHLDVLHVEANASDAQNSFESEKQLFNSLFKNYNPQFHFLENENFTDAINQFALENNSDLIIVIPKKHGLFEGIFSKSHTKALAFHSHIPLMTIHE